MNYIFVLPNCVQVLSESVSKALFLVGGEDARETARFVAMFDKFFDCFNVSSFEKGNKSRKSFQQPYRSANDYHLKVQQKIN